MCQETLVQTRSQFLRVFLPFSMTTQTTHWRPLCDTSTQLAMWFYRLCTFFCHSLQMLDVMFIRNTNAFLIKLLLDGRANQHLEILHSCERIFNKYCNFFIVLGWQKTSVHEPAQIKTGLHTIAPKITENLVFFYTCNLAELTLSPVWSDTADEDLRFTFGSYISAAKQTN